MNIQQMMKQAQQLQKQMAQRQEELGKKNYEASSGGGMVTVCANGRNELTSIKIEKDVVDANDVSMLQDLVLAAVNEVIRKVKADQDQEMNQVVGNLGIKIPGMM